MSDRRGQYRLVREIGRGGMAIVHEAEHVTLGRRAAVKVLHATLARSAIAEARFAREARIGATLRHPHVAEVYDYGSEDGEPYLVLELAERGSLATFLKERGPLSLPAALEILLPIASGLAHAHERGIVHRDMKPANVLLAEDRRGLVGRPDPDRDSGGVVPKICDFGIGKSNGPDEERLTADGAILGTLAYMPPEQLRAPSSAGPAADQYALAAILYEAITGQLLFGPAPTLEWIQRILDGGPTPPSHVRQELPAEIDPILLRALSAEPEARYPSVLAFASELLRFASGRTWTTWAREFGAARDAEGITADDDARAARSLEAPRPAQPARIGRRWRAVAMLACAGAFALGFGTSRALNRDVNELASRASAKASKGALEVVATRDVLGVGADVSVEVPAGPPAPPPPAHAAPAPSRIEPDARSTGDDAITRVADKTTSRSYGANRAPILE